MTTFRTRIPPLDIAVRLLLLLSVLLSALLPLTATEHSKHEPPDKQQQHIQSDTWYHDDTRPTHQQGKQQQWYQQGNWYPQGTQKPQYQQNSQYVQSAQVLQNPQYQQQDSQYRWNPQYKHEPQLYQQQDSDYSQDSGHYVNPQYKGGDDDQVDSQYQTFQHGSQYENPTYRQISEQSANPQYQEESVNQQSAFQNSRRVTNSQNRQNSGRRKGRKRRRQDLNSPKPDRKRKRKARQNPELQENPLYRQKSDRKDRQKSARQKSNRQKSGRQKSDRPERQRQRRPKNQDPWKQQPGPNFGANGQEPQHTGPDYKRPPLHDSLYLTPNQTIVTARVGNMAHLPCVIQHLGTKQVSWYRDHEEHILTIGHITWVRNSSVRINYHEFSNEITHWNLTITRVKTEDEGVYNCEIIDKQKMINQVRLRVTDPPEYKPEIRIFGKEYVDLGEQVRLVCNATGGDLIPEDIDWFKDGDIVDSMRFKNIIITKYRSLEDQALVSELIIDRSKGEDSGTYICRSSENEIDSMEVTVLVANSSNVKRGSGSGSGLQKVRAEHPLNKAAFHISSTLNLTTVLAILTLVFTKLWTS